MPFDHKSLVENMIHKYVKPEFPIYKIQYISTKSKSLYELDTEVYTRIVECRENPLNPSLKLELSKSPEHKK